MCPPEDWTCCRGGETCLERCARQGALGQGLAQHLSLISSVGLRGSQKGGGAPCCFAHWGQRDVARSG